MGIKNIYERFIWFDSRVRAKKYPNTTALANQFEISTKTALRDIDFMRDRLYCPLDYGAMEILRHGDMVEVIKPKSLRELIKAEAENITKIY